LHHLGSQRVELLAKVISSVIPAKAGVQDFLELQSKISNDSTGASGSITGLTIIGTGGRMAG
jgi:hypothetical protein